MTMLRIACSNFPSRNCTALRKFFIFNSSEVRNKTVCQRNSFSGLSLSILKEPVTHTSFSQTFLVRMSSNQKSRQEKNRSTLMYICAMGIFMGGMAYAGVPLYRLFCQATGLNTTPTKVNESKKIETMKPVGDRIFKVQFNADTAASMQWNFRPQQSEVKVVPGETVLVFYSAKNPSDEPIVGISTYNVIPAEAGLYFNKIQCFCFEEQRLNPHEEVDLPVFFFLDPEIADDASLSQTDTIILSYTFFESKDAQKLKLALPPLAAGASKQPTVKQERIPQ